MRKDLGTFEGHHASRCRGFSLPAGQAQNGSAFIAMALFLATVAALCLGWL